MGIRSDVRNSIDNVVQDNAQAEVIPSFYVNGAVDTDLSKMSAEDLLMGPCKSVGGRRRGKLCCATWIATSE